ncbi:MAG: hypothetical protein H7Y11_03530 [Armatimonadetes bacterium]|nr:hypothetical protein [Anaerolineae bacterium]
MSRVINTDGPGKKRNQLMRTAAELVRRLSQKSAIDDDAKDMLAMLVFCMREIDDGIEESSKAWEKRDYWMKAEEFRQRWMWAGKTADELKDILFREDWAALPTLMLRLLPQFAEIKITKFTRAESTWALAYTRLAEEKPPQS